ncbi:MAG: DUF2817 domain-containing protein [Candidatus Latescibacteria bacterium]|nr:DUF2817 domain-containing protein [Candidatus Latescibacterota bacterium]
MEKRSYEEVVRRVEALADKVGTLDSLGAIDGLPVFRLVVRGKEEPRLRVLLTGGVHGDEPAGVEAVLGFLEEDILTWTAAVEFTVVPCVNPSGYSRDQRENAAGVDINRAFDSDDEPEVRLIKQLVQDLDLDVGIDCHEDWEANGFYMYEGLHQGEPAGPAVIKRVETVGPIDPDSGEDSQPVSRGVYEISPSWGTSGLGPYLLHHCVRHALILETPTRWPLEQRAAAHRGALDTALRHWVGG